MTNRKQKLEKPSKELIDRLWNEAVNETRNRRNEADELIEQGYKPYSLFCEQTGIPEGRRSYELKLLKQKGWDSKKATYNGSQTNFIRPPIK